MTEFCTTRLFTPCRFSGLFVLCYLLYAVISAPSHADAAPLLLTASEERVSLAGHLEILIDESGKLSINDVTSPPYNSRFASIPGYLTAGYLPHGAVWLRFTVQRTADSPSVWLLESDPAFIEDLSLYLPSDSGGFDTFQGGTLLPFSKRSTSYRLDLFKLSLPQTRITVHMRIDSNRAIYARPVFWQLDGHRKKIERESLFHGAAIGIMSLIALISLMYWIWLKRSLYGYYFFYVLSIGYYFLSIYGYAHQFFWPEITWIIAPASRINYLILLMLNVGMFSEMLNLRNHLPRFDRIYRCAAVGFSFICTILIFFGFYDRLILPIKISLLTSICTGIIVSTLLIRRSVGAKVYLLAFSVLLISAAIKILNDLGVLPHSTLVNNIFLVSTFFHLLVLKIAILKQIVDIKREKFVVEAALAAERQTVSNQRQFLRLISHELRTPLSVIDSSAQIIAFVSNDPEQVERSADDIRSAAHNLSNLMTKYLTHERLESGGIIPDDAPVNICSILKKLVFHIQETTDSHLIIFDMQDSPPAISCDPLLIEMLAGLLLDNAIKYSPHGGSVVLHAFSLETGCFSFKISDSGVGMTEEQLKCIFTPYYRAKSLPGVSGLGLGLHLAKHIAELHGGSITCTSTPGQGSTFTVHLKNLVADNGAQ